MILKAIYDFVVFLLRVIWAIITSIIETLPAVYFACYVIYGVYLISKKEEISNNYLFMGVLLSTYYITYYIDNKIKK